MNSVAMLEPPKEAVPRYEILDIPPKRQEQEEERTLNN